MSSHWLHYFAYGSNMHPPRLRERTPSCRWLGVTRLDGYHLRFHQRSTTDGSAKCNILATGNPADRVHGVVYAIPAAERPALDAAEDLGRGYRIHELQIALDNAPLRAFCYVAMDGTTDDGLRPFRWYRDIVLLGARRHDFPEDYLAAIAAEPVMEDPDHRRAEHHARLLALAD